MLEEIARSNQQVQTSADLIYTEKSWWYWQIMAVSLHIVCMWEGKVGWFRGGKKKGCFLSCMQEYINKAT